MHRDLVVYAVATIALTAGCGEELDIDETTTPVTLHPLDESPGCYVDPAPSVAGGMMEQTYQMTLSFNMQRAALLLKPIYEDPTASDWRVVNDDGQATIEAQVIARGEGWGFLVAAVVPNPELADYAFSAEVKYTTASTVIDFGEESLVQANNYIRTDILTLGCDPTSGWSFRIGPGIRDGQLVDEVTTCWDSTGQPLEASGGTDREQAEATASFNLRCIQVIQKTLR